MSAVDLSLAARRVLEISTGHIPKHTADALGNTYDDGQDYHDAVRDGTLWEVLSYEGTPYGWMLWVCDEWNDDESKAHPELANLLKLAAENGFSYLMLDCDAMELDGLPTFDW